MKFSVRQKALWCAALALCLCACQHRIDPEKLTAPPRASMDGVDVSKVSRLEALAELEAIAATPYPPYLIQGGDTFRIRVYDEDELNGASTTPTVVTPDGYLVMGLVDPVLVKDLTIIEATQKVRKELERFVKYPHVSLIPEHIGGEQATLFGAVREPGSYSVSSNVRLADFVASGGGLAVGILDDNSVELADIASSYLVRGGKILPIDFSEAIYRGNPLHNVRIFPGDIVFIARREDSRVMVMGEVYRPRIVNWTENLTVLEALAQGEGLKDEYWTYGLILRREKDAPLSVYRVNLHDLLAGRCPNYRLAAGDILYIPKDSISEYNVFIKKLMPTAQFTNLLMTPFSYWMGGRR